MSNKYRDNSKNTCKELEDNPNKITLTEILFILICIIVLL